MHLHHTPLVWASSRARAHTTWGITLAHAVHYVALYTCVITGNCYCVIAACLAHSLILVWRVIATTGTCTVLLLGYVSC